MMLRKVIVHETALFSGNMNRNNVKAKESAI